MRQKKICYILFCVVLCALTMGIIDGIVQPGYVTKSAIKAALFLLGPLGYFFLFPQERTHVKALLRPQGKAVLFALALGAAVYGIILGGYFLLRQALDIDAIALQLTADGGVRAEDFLWISLYICLVNSALEELLFRGFAFFCLKDLTSRPFAYLFSAVVFAGYHFGMFAGSNAPLIWLLVMAALTAAGAVLDYLNERTGSIYPSWLVHMCANLGINTVGFIVFGMI